MLSTFVRLVMLGILGVAAVGCGNTKTQRATEQLLMSDSVDRAVSAIDFRPLSGKRVYLDTKYVSHIKGDGVVNAQYVISALRQQLVAASCQLEESIDKAEYVVEARVGALATDSHDVTYGLPASNALSSAASLLPNAPPIPVIPEISFAKRTDDMGATKVAVFAYHRETKTAVWQSGTSQARSSAKNVWLFGAGPFQSGTVFGGPQFAGEKIPLISGKEGDGPDPLTLYNKERFYVQEPERKVEQEVLQASYDKAAPPADAAPGEAANKATEAAKPPPKPPQEQSSSPEDGNKK